MDYVNYRKYPRKFKRHSEKESEKAISFSLTAAAGILAFAFINGLGLGYFLKKRCR